MMQPITSSAEHVIKLAEGLWVGQLPAEQVGDFDRFILCTENEAEVGNYGDNVFRATMPAVTSDENLYNILQIGLAVAGWIKRGKTVLISCFVNSYRSSFIAAVCLLCLGVGVDEAVTKIRASQGEEAIQQVDLLLLNNLAKNQKGLGF